jgi:DNA-binding FadR family transcriptional regulator
MSAKYVFKRCYERQSVYAGFHESIAAAIAARNGQVVFAQIQRHLDDERQYIQQQVFPFSDATQ